MDFWLRLPDYQVTHNIGVAPAGGARQPYPYPVLFYLTAHMGNRLYHNPEIWLKATAALALKHPELGSPFRGFLRDLL